MLVRRSVRTDEDRLENRYGRVLNERRIIHIFGEIHEVGKSLRAWYDTNESQGHASSTVNSDVTFTFAIEDPLVVHGILAWA